jgi:hypothetical protein
MDQGTFGPRYVVVNDRMGVCDWTMHAASCTAACCSIRVCLEFYRKQGLRLINRIPTKLLSSQRKKGAKHESHVALEEIEPTQARRHYKFLASGSNFGSASSVDSYQAYIGGFLWKQDIGKSRPVP